MATRTHSAKRLRSRDEIRAAGREFGKTAPPLTEAQINTCAAILAPVFTKVPAERGAA